MADTQRSPTSEHCSSLAYRTGFYVGALRGYQTVSEVSSVEGPDFCQGFADGMEGVLRWLRHYLTEGGTFDGAVGELMPYYPSLRAWVGDSNGPNAGRPVHLPSRRERQRRRWEREVDAILTDDRWSTSKEIFERLGARGPRSLQTLNQLLRAMAESGLVERSQTVDLIKGRSSEVRWRRSSPSGVTAVAR